MSMSIFNAIFCDSKVICNEFDAEVVIVSGAAMTFTECKMSQIKILDMILEL